jgi:hypothetical protein
MTFWQDRFLPGQPLSYSNIGNNDLTIGQLQHGNQERLENLQWAQERWDGLMGVVIVRAVDQNAQDRAIGEAFPRKDLLMRLSELRVDSGEFSAVNVGTWEQLRSIHNA